MYQVGIDIGSSAAKVAVMEHGAVIKTLLLSTGFNSRNTADEIYQTLEKDGINKENAVYVATGYGRISVPYANRSVTEITCHGKGAWFLFGENGTVVDIGGQDTKGIALKNGRVMKFIMNDKCSAGTGKFLEVMTNRLGLTQKELSEKTGIYQADISKLERGLGNPSLSTLKRLADGLNMDIYINFAKKKE